LLGILTREDAQVILVDTPGLHAPQHRLGEIMVEVAETALPDADVVLWVVDLSVDPTEEDRLVASRLAALASDIPLVLALNKADLLAGEAFPGRVDAYRSLAPRAQAVQVSALHGEGLQQLVEAVIGGLPEGPRYYPAEQVTDQQERFMAAELVREQVLLHLRQEVPHAIAVAVNEFKERRDNLTYISATIYVERETQKGIVLGRDGQMLKRIGQSARRSIEELLGTRVYLDLWVKVRPKWRSKDEELRRLGYSRPEGD
jgi:GTP-binding protein Era